MSSFLSKSLVFILLVALLVGCSHANHEFPQDSKMERKLLTIPQLDRIRSFVGKWFGPRSREGFKFVVEAGDKVLAMEDRCEIAKNQFACGKSKDCGGLPICLIQFIQGKISCTQTCAAPKQGRCVFKNNRVYLGNIPIPFKDIRHRCSVK